METPYSTGGKVALAKSMWVSPAQKPTENWADCSILLKWFDEDEVFEVDATWHQDDPKGSGCAYFEYMLFDDQHMTACQVKDTGDRILGCRYKTEDGHAA